MIIEHLRGIKVQLLTKKSRSYKLTWSLRPTNDANIQGGTVERVNIDSYSLL